MGEMMRAAPPLKAGYFPTRPPGLQSGGASSSKYPVKTLNAQTDRSEKAIGLPNTCLIRVRTQ